jgi:hypothetical protein
VIRRLLRRLAEWVTADPSPDLRTMVERKLGDEILRRSDEVTAELIGTREPDLVGVFPDDEPDWGDPWDADDLPSTADPGVVTDPTRED